MFEFTHTNHLMEIALEKIAKGKNLKLKGNLPHFTNLILAPIICKEDCYLLSSVANLSSEATYKNYTNRTECEVSQNHIHIFDYTTGKSRNLILLKIGIDVARMLAYRLKLEASECRFKISVSYDIENEFGYNDCVVRFHKVRENEEYLGDNPRYFPTSAAVGVIEV